MSTYTDKFFADKAVGALWDVAVSIKRGNPLPLDKDSVVHGLTELNAIATGSVSYPGQIIAVVEDAVYEGEGEDKVLVTEESVTLYYLDHNKTPREVGKVPTGDGKTIEVTTEGAISLLGSADAADGTLPMLEDGALVWKTLEDIGAGDGNDNTTYEFTKLTKGEGDAIECYGFKVKVKENGVATGDPIEIALDVYTKSEADAKFQPIGNYKTTQEAKEFSGSTIQTVTSVTQDTNGVVSVTFENIAFPEDKNTTYTLGYESKVEGEDGHPARIVLTPSEGEATYVDATPFIKDGMLDNVEYDADTNTLTFTFNTDAGKEAVEVELTDILAPYTGKDGERVKVTVTGTEIAADLKAGTITKDYLDTGVQTSLGLADTALQEHQDISHLAIKTEVETAIGTAKSEAIADAAGKYATKEYVGNIPEDYDETNVIAYVNKKAQEVLDSATGGSSESAASIKQQLDTYKAANDPKVKALLEEVWGSETYTGDSRIDTLVADLAQATATANAAIKEVKPATGAKIIVNTANNVATIDDSALAALITTAQNKADEAAGAAATNATAIETANGKITNLENSVNGTEGTDGLLTRMANAEGKITTAEATIRSHGESITALNGTIATKAEQTALDNAVARIATNETAITTLNETTIPGINEEVAKKANIADLYTKKEIDDMVAEAGDTSALETRVKANEDAIAAIDFVDDDELAAAIKVETDRADTEEKRLAGLIADNTTAIAGNTAVINSILGNEDETDLNSIAELAAWINEHGTEASGMAEAIEENATAIAGLTSTTGTHTTEIDNLQALVGADALVEGDSTLIARIAALEGAGHITAADLGNDGAVGVSTDRLFNGSEELIFVAGDAGVKAAE